MSKNLAEQLKNSGIVVGVSVLLLSSSKLLNKNVKRRLASILIGTLLTKVTLIYLKGNIPDL